MAKTKQPELLLQAEIIGNKGTETHRPLGLRGQGFYAEKQSERFKAGRPDLRVARNDLGQLDVELKYYPGQWGDYSIEPGFTKLQWLRMREMNDHGIPTVGLVFMAQYGRFVLTIDKVLQPGLLTGPHTCLKLPAPQIIDGAALFGAAKGLLHDAGYRHRW